MAQYDRLAVTVNDDGGRRTRVLDGKVAIVTGTSRGVGVGIAHELLRAGATVVGCSRSPLNAVPGIEAEWAAVQMNLISPLWFAIRVFRQMATQDGVGCIVNISSGAGHPAGSPTLVSYGAAKSGLNQLTRSLAQEWGPNVRVNCVALGPTMTENFQSFVLPEDDPTGERYFAAVPLRRAGEPAEVGRVCVFLPGGTADFVNGTTIECDGGMLPGVLYEAGLKTITDLL